MSHVFDEAIAVEALDSDTFRAQTHAAYNNMVGPFGGITVATVVGALQRHEAAQGDPLAITLNYAAPIGSGTWLLRVQVARTNRTNQHWVFTIEQEGQTVATGTAVFAVHRDGWESVEAVMPFGGDPDALSPLKFPVPVDWTDNYDMRFVTGPIDAEAGPQKDSTSTLWLKDLPDRALDFPALAAMSDGFFPRVFLRRGEFVPAGTISLTTYFHASADDLATQGSAPILATARAARFGGGHFDQYGTLWGTHGALLATTHQLVYFKG